MSLDIVEKLTPAAGHGDQATAAMKVLAMSTQVICEVCDALRQQGDLDFRGTCIGFVHLEIGDY